ncbi:MAG: hypothetical protein WCK84_11560 [Bacteroidota bacterium]
MDFKKFYFHLTYLPEGKSFSMLARNLIDPENYTVPISYIYDPQYFDFTTKKDFKKYYLLSPSRDAEIRKVIQAFLKDDNQIAINFLNYQLKIYTENGEDPKNFFNFIKEMLMGSFKKLLPEGKPPIYLDWVEEKKRELYQTSTLEQVAHNHLKRKRPPKLNEHNKPVLTQVQISILFKIMKDKRIISNRDLPTTAYSEVIQILTGFSDNTLRTNFSIPQFIDISDRPKDYDEIIACMYQVIHELEKARNEINQK